MVAVVSLITLLRVTLFLLNLYDTFGLEETQVVYLSFSENTSLVENPVTPGQNFANVKRSDDSPFERLTLPWKFNFLGRNVEEVFVSPNGALHYSPTQPCATINIFATSSCTFDSSYYNVIGGYLTDLDPSKSVNGFIQSMLGENFIEVVYTNIVYYNSTIGNSFRIRLHKDNHIEIIYDDIQRTSDLPQAGYWASGVRGDATNLYAHFTAEQIQRAAAEWGSSVPSVYPRQKDVATGKMFTLCPVSRTWCLQPAVVSLSSSGGSASSSLVQVTSLLLSCTSKAHYGLLIANATTTFNVSCTAVGASTTLACSISSLLTGEGLAAGNWSVKPAWRVGGAAAGSLFTALPVEPLLLLVLNSESDSNSNFAAGCSTNLLPGSRCTADACAICSGNLTCLGLPCASDSSTLALSSASTSSIFERTTCANDTCPAKNRTYSYFPDKISTPTRCCLESAMDCSGQCGGVSVAALDQSGAGYCCDNSSRVDCAGVCDGTATRDVCGTCQGTDFTGLGCFSPSEVVFSTGSVDGAWYPVFDVDPSVKDGLVRFMGLNITNKSRFPIQVFLAEAEEKRNDAPLLSYLAGLRPVGVNETIYYEVRASLELLYAGNVSTWGAKDMVATFRRQSYPQVSYTHLITTYPASVNCGAVTSRSACMRLPACIFCVTDPNMRLLREREHDQEHEGRQLFVEVIPNRLYFQGDAPAGVCGEGWMNADCAVIAPNSYVGDAAPCAAQISQLGMALLMVTHAIFHFLPAY